ncbi:MAG: ACP S-malonyltransferase [Planctomycetales bacterium]|nr:ACP S-malonyltransferase [Planctomycetales bacterium]
MSRPAFLFPGQGAQAVGMGKQLAETLPAARALYDQAKQILGYDLAKICFEGPAEQLNSTVHSQPALFVTSLAGVESLKATQPDVVAAAAATAGLSLGEYTALVFAGVMSFEDGLRVVQQRGRAMQDAADAVPSGMVSILGMEAAKIEELCNQARGDGEVLQIANYLCPGNIVVSGHKTACVKIAELATAAGAMKTIPLEVAGAFHTPIMQPAVAKLAAALAGVKLSSPRIPVVSNVDAAPHSDPEEIRSLLVKQVVSPVRWEDSQRYLLNQGYAPHWEIGPGRVLRGLLKRIERKAAAEGVEC